jgi:AraC-like DNA-binding protein
MDKDKVKLYYDRYKRRLPKNDRVDRLDPENVGMSRSIFITRSLSAKNKVKADVVLGTAQNGVTTWNGVGDFFALATYFQFEGLLPKIVFGNLPSVIHIPGHLDQAAILHWTLERFSAEFRGNSVGRSLILNNLAPIMLMQILRVYLASNKNEKNWLVALSDPKLSKTIEAMHSEYQRHWSLGDLAQVAGMSRSGFSLNFKKQAGVAPMDYLTNWRMQTACDLLQSGDQNLAAIANAVGYESESAFSLAFKKAIGCRPGAYLKPAKT